MKKIVNIVVNTFENDARVYRTAQVGQNFADQVVVLAMHDDQLLEYETQNGIEIRRFKLRTKNLPKAKIFQAIKFIELNVRIILYFIRNRSIELIHAHDLSALPMGFIGKCITKSKLIYDSHELFSSRAMNVPFIKIALKLERILAKRCDEVVTVSESIADVLKLQLDLNSRPLVIRNIPNYLPPLQSGQGKLRKYLGISEDKIVLIYQGGVFLDRGIELLIKAVDTINSENLYLVVLGNGALKSRLLESSGVKDRKNIVFLDAVPHTELHFWTSDANIGVSPIIGKSLSYKYCLPNKLFEYIRAGLPVIVSDLPDMSALVEKHNVGFIFKENNLEDLVHKIQLFLSDRSLLDEYSKNSFIAAEVLNWEVEKEMLSDKYQDLLQLD